MKTSLVLGFFDGVHLGHKSVIENALSHDLPTKLITFKASPSEFFTGNAEYIFPREYNIKKIKSLNVEEVVLEDFSKIADIEAEQYLNMLKEKYNPKYIFTGFNYTFGKNKLGNPDTLKAFENKYGYKYFCIEPKTFNGEIVSSTFIKNCLKEGNIEKANAMLGEKFFITGKVIHGAKLGKKIGFPTANVEYPKNITKIPFGVYLAKLDDKYGIMNYGIKPTINGNNIPITETHIFDFSGDLYGKNVKIEIIKKIREEQKFDNLDKLKEQINKDIKTCLEWL